MSNKGENENNPPLITLTLFGYGSASAKAWAFAQMGLARRAISQASGLRFWKLMGSGQGGGFSVKPDFSRYALLCVWDTPAMSQIFFNKKQVMQNFRNRADEMWTVSLSPVKAHGRWSGANPFLPLNEPRGDKPVAVLTRATIRLNKLHRFWKHVPETSRELNNAEGLIASIGIGEAPFVQQATFSLWRREQDVQNFAYKGAIHKEVMKRTRRENWYAEELFARFTPISSEGIWNGRDPLEGLI